MTAVDLIRWLGETSLAVSILIILVLIIRKPFAKAFGARAAYLLWLAPAARPFLPELKLLPAPPSIPADAMLAPVYSWQIEAGAMAAPPAATFDWLALAAAAALVIWATVAFAWFSLKMEAQSRYRKDRIARSQPAGQAVAAMAAAIAKDLGLRRMPAIRISETDDQGPCLIGLMRPVIFLPAEFENKYDRREQQLALAHELAHVARGDMGATLIALALQAAQWPNPLAHLSFKAFRTDQEAACDAYVLARCAKGRDAASDYAAAILKSVRTGATSPAYGLALAHPVKERLMLLRNPKKSPLRLVAGAVCVAAFTTASLAATASYGVADQKIVVAIDQDATDDAKKTKSTRTITVDADEELDIEGVDGARKIEIKEENGDRVVKIFDQDGNLISENTYGPEDEAPFSEVIVKGKDGKEKTIQLTRIGGGAFSFSGDMDFNFDHDIRLDGDKRMMIFSSKDRHGIELADCDDSGQGGVQLFEWTDEESENGTKDLRREVICIGGDEADPEKRAEALRSAIDRMEESAKADAERRKEIIKKMREQLREAEREARNN